VYKVRGKEQYRTNYINRPLGLILCVSYLEDPKTKQAGIVEEGVLQNKERDRIVF
jgi:hypothetical protein